jgi:hypothetical protein
VSAEISEWIDPDGNVTTLDVDWQATGRFMPGIKFESTGIPGQPGEYFRAARHDVHEFTIRVTLATGSEPTLRTAQRDLVTAMNPVRGEGILRVTSPLSDVREIACRYSEGLGMDEKPGNSGPTMQQCDITFKAFEPYWRDASDTSASYTIGAIPTFFPIFPIRLTASEIAVDDVAVNNGDVETWPVWEIGGPATSITLRNLTTGEYMTFTGVTLDAGESITIDTRPTGPSPKTVRLDDGTSLYSSLTSISSLWALPVGSSSIRLEMGSAIAGTSYLQVSYRQRYLSP